MESDSGNDREEVEDEKGGSVKESEKVEEEEEAPKASVESKASELISHGSTTAILDDLEQLIINLNPSFNQPIHPNVNLCKCPCSYLKAHTFKC